VGEERYWTGIVGEERYLRGIVGEERYCRGGEVLVEVLWRRRGIGKVLFLSSLTTALDGGERFTSGLSCFLQEEEP
jgi:GNAT superfamily N-acetyltransferase